MSVQVYKEPEVITSKELKAVASHLLKMAKIVKKNNGTCFGIIEFAQSETVNSENSIVSTFSMATVKVSASEHHARNKVEIE